MNPCTHTQGQMLSESKCLNLFAAYASFKKKGTLVSSCKTPQLSDPNTSFKKISEMSQVSHHFIWPNIHRRDFCLDPNTKGELFVALAALKTTSSLTHCAVINVQRRECNCCGAEESLCCSLALQLFGMC